MVLPGWGEGGDAVDDVDGEEVGEEVEWIFGVGDVFGEGAFEGGEEEAEDYFGAEGAFDDADGYVGV